MNCSIADLEIFILLISHLQSRSTELGLQIVTTVFKTLIGVLNFTEITILWPIPKIMKTRYLNGMRS